MAPFEHGCLSEFEAAFEVKVRQVYFETEDKRTDRRVPKQLNRLYQRASSANPAIAPGDNHNPVRIRSGRPSQPPCACAPS